MRWIFRLVMAVVVVIIAAVVLVVVLPGEKIAKLAADQVKAQTGRDLTFEGEVKISWYPVLGVATGPVTLSNASWSDAGPMFRAQSAAIGVDMMALMGGNIRIKQIEVVGPDVVLEKARDGRVNWELLPAGEAVAGADSSGAAPAFSLDKLSVRDARLRYVDHGGDTLEIADLDASLVWGGAGKPADITLRLTPYGEVIEVSATVADLTGMLEGGVSAVVAEVEAAGATVSFDGRGGIAPQMAGVISADIPKPDALLRALGQEAAGVPGAVSFGGEVTFTKAAKLSLRKGRAALGPNAVSLAADVDLGGDRPQVTAQVVAGALDFSAFLASDDNSEAGDGWSTAAIDASALGAVDGVITLAAESIDLGTLKFASSRVKVSVERSRAVFALQELQGYDGVITGEFVANNRSGLSVGGTLNANALEMSTLLADLADISRFTGKATAKLSFLGGGQSVDAIMKSLKGSGSMNVGSGTITGFDLDKLFRGSTGGGTTVFDSMSATMQIAGGVVSNEDLLMELPSVLAKGKGTIGLGAQDINYTFVPQLRSETDNGIAVPVRIKGPWSSPKIWPDLEAVIDQNFSEEKKQLEEKLENKVKDKLGVTTEEGQSVEDALKQKLEKKVGDKLLNLLGGD